MLLRDSLSRGTLVIQALECAVSAHELMTPFPYLEVDVKTFLVLVAHEHAVRCRRSIVCGTAVQCAQLRS
jgi:hypothetical protein